MGKQAAQQAMAEIVETVAASKKSACEVGGDSRIDADLAGVTKLSDLLDRLPGDER